MAAADYISTVQGFYVSYYGRPADPAGLTYWTERLNTEGGNLNAILSAFGTSEEATRRFGTGTDTAKVTAIYQQTFGRAPEAGPTGIDFYLNGLSNGTFTLITIAKAIIDGAQGDDKTTVQNRTAAANTFTTALNTDAEKAGYSGLSAEDAARAWITTVTKDPATVTAAAATVDATITSLLPQTFTLTISTTDNFVGGAGNDKFVGSVSNLGGTLQATDKMDGGAGEDRLELTQGTAWSGFSTGYVKNIETIALTNSGGTAANFSGNGITGLKTLSLDGTNAGFSITDLPTGVTTISLAGQKSGTLNTTFKAGSTETGTTATSDAVTFQVTGVGSTSAVTVDLRSYETLNIVSNGTTTNKVDDATATSSTTKMSVSGSAAITIANVSAALTSFDASAATGVVTATLDDAGTTALTLVKTGTAADTVTLDQADTTSTATIDMGTGVDTLKLTAGGTAQYRMSGVENLSVDSTGSDFLLIATNVSGLTKVTHVAAADDRITLTDMGSASMEFVSSGATVDETGATAANADVLSDHKGSTVVNYSALAAATTIVNPSADYSFSEATGSLTVNVNALIANVGGTVTADKAASVALNIDGTKDTNSAVTRWDSTITAGEATSFTVNATGVLGSDTNTATTAPAGSGLALAKATSGTITNGTNAGAIELSTPKLTSLNVISGEDFTIQDITGGGTPTPLAKLQNLDVNISKGAFRIGTTTLSNDANLASIAGLTLSGSGTTSKVTLGDIGSAANGYDLNINASGLKGSHTAASNQTGLTLGSLIVGTGYNVSVNVSGVTGGVTIADIDDSDTASANDLPKNITLNAAGMGGVLTVTNAIKGSGVVNVNAAGAYDVALTTIEGDVVTVDVSGTVKSDGAVVGNITAKTSANVSYGTLVGNTQTILGSSTSTALAVTVNGSALADDITVTGGAAQTMITISGDLKATADTLRVNNTASTATGINISAMLNYDTAYLSTGAGAQTITGGAGVDIIRGGPNAAGSGDTLIGGDGKDTFRFDAGDSPYTAPDTINDFKSGDEIFFGAANVVLAKSVTGSSGIATLDAFGVATFALSGTISSLQAAANAVSAAIGDSSTASKNAAFFVYGGDTYLLVDNNTTNGAGDAVTVNDVVIKLVGVSVPGTDLTANGDGTGLSGFGS